MTQMAKVSGQIVADILGKTKALTPSERFILGIVGAPASGKSTISAEIIEAVNEEAGSEIAIVVPMDGFHRSNQELKAWGIWELKGIPDSFNAQGFVELLKGLREQTDRTVGCPAFDRAIEEPAENAILVKANHKLVVVEGNYLLLQNEPWNEIKPLLNEVWFIESSRAVIEPRLLERHIKGGRTEAAARLKMESTDLPNARLIEATRELADLVI
jgi:pantothenate kinase